MSSSLSKRLQAGTQAGKLSTLILNLHRRQPSPDPHADPDPAMTTLHRRCGSSEPVPQRVHSMDEQAAVERTFTSPEEAIEAAFATPRCAVRLSLRVHSQMHVYAAEAAS